MGSEAAESWDHEYAQGVRYQGDPPVRFVEDIVLAAKESGATRGVYVGCGNGRNYVPLVEAGLDLVGLDISQIAIDQLAGRLPAARRDRLVVGDLSALPAGETWPLVVAIQVLQHGTRDEVHAFLTGILARVAPGGLLAVRVNATGTDIEHPSETVERFPDGSFTVQYEAGPKEGLHVHFWAARELNDAVTDAGFTPVLEVRPDSTWRHPMPRGQWLQWEGLWRRTR